MAPVRRTATSVIQRLLLRMQRTLRTVPPSKPNLRGRRLLATLSWIVGRSSVPVVHLPQSSVRQKMAAPESAFGARWTVHFEPSLTSARFDSEFTLVTVCVVPIATAAGGPIPVRSNHLRDPVWALGILRPEHGFVLRSA
jgi:hypothetical protein